MEKYGIAVGVERLSKDQDDRLYAIYKNMLPVPEDTDDLLPRTTSPKSASSSQRVDSVDEEYVTEKGDQGEDEEEEEMEEEEMVERGVTDSIEAVTTKTGYEKCNLQYFNFYYFLLIITRNYIFTSSL